MNGLIDKIKDEINRKIREQYNTIQGDDLTVGVIVGLKVALQIINKCVKYGEWK